MHTQNNITGALPDYICDSETLHVALFGPKKMVKVHRGYAQKDPNIYFGSFHFALWHTIVEHQTF